MTPELAAAKAYPITEYLAAKGHSPQTARGSQLYYLSPLKHEKTPSFTVNPQKNLFHCFATGKGGDVLQLVQLLEGCTFLQALQRLGHAPVPEAAQLPPSSQAETNTALVLRKIKPLENRALLQYLEGRGIAPQLVRFVPQLKEAYYDYGHRRNLFALAFANDQNGHELRNGIGNQGKGFKGCVGKKWYTTVHGTEGRECVVFEGFMDFLSYLQYRQSPRLKADALILNSGTMAEKAAPALANYRRVHLLLDNDQAGHQATDILRKAHPQARDIRHVLQGRKDVNEWILAT